MSFTFDFTATATDFCRMMRIRHSRVSTVLRLLIALVILGYACCVAYGAGPTWSLLFYVWIAAACFSPFVAFHLLTLTYFALRPLHAHVVVDEEGVLVRTGRSSRTILWDAFSREGKAIESSVEFWLTCSTGNVWIPKRAITSSREMDDFRLFVTNRVGDGFEFESTDRVDDP